MSIAREFREFAVKGNVMDLAVGVIIGAAFGKIVSSIVEDIVMPVIGTLMGGLSFADLALKVGSATIKYGKFLQTCLDFFLIAVAVFLLVKLINRIKREEEKPAALKPRQEALLEEIRDLLSAQAKANRQ
jgi:large conductance mechanosensitive channel